jgi:hypothetical protein
MNNFYFPDDMWRIILQFGISDIYNPDDYIFERFESNWDRCFDGRKVLKIFKWRYEKDEIFDYKRKHISINPRKSFYLYQHKIRVLGIRIPLKYKNGFGSNVPLKFIKEESDFLHFELLSVFGKGISSAIHIYFRTDPCECHNIVLYIRRHKSIQRSYGEA